MARTETSQPDLNQSRRSGQHKPASSLSLKLLFIIFTRHITAVLVTDFILSAQLHSHQSTETPLPLGTLPQRRTCQASHIHQQYLNHASTTLQLTAGSPRPQGLCPMSDTYRIEYASTPCMGTMRESIHALGNFQSFQGCHQVPIPLVGLGPVAWPT